MKRLIPYTGYLFFITAIILVFLSAGSFMRISGDPNVKVAYIVYAVLMFSDAIAMLICGLYINRRVKIIYWFAVIVLSLNIMLSIFDQFGLADFLFVMLNIVTLIPLIVYRKDFLPQ
ncbi:MAG: hypothetical protein HZB50_11550 [Chloroflexi bacterium]|nr:hypothetical protein [Chloroflexota bacterium]